MSSNRGYIQMGPHFIARHYGTEHFQFIGATGSGKTINLKVMISSVLRDPHSERLFTYDAKTELVSFLYSVLGETEHTVKNGKSRVIILNPFDARSYCWDISKDILSPVGARQFATILVPDAEAKGSGDSFFENTVRDCLTVLTLVFINCSAAWTFSDLLVAALNRNYTIRLLEIGAEQDNPCSLDAQRVLDDYFQLEDERTAANIRASINARLAVYAPLAALWEYSRLAGRSFSISDWAKDGSTGILVMGNDEEARASLDVLNRALFKRVTETVLNRREATRVERKTGTNQTWFFLDEIREAGKLPGLTSLLNRGRSRGCCVALGYQDILGLRDIYGTEAADELTGQCGNSGFLRITNPVTAKWAAESFGSMLRRVRSSGIGIGKEGTTHNHSVQDEERPLLYTSDFIYTPPAGFKNGVFGHYLLAGEHVSSPEDAYAQFGPADIAAALPSHESLEPGSWLSDFIPRPVSEQYLKAFSQEDWDRLRLPGAPPPPRSPRPEEGPSASEMLQSVLDSQTRRP